MAITTQPLLGISGIDAQVIYQRTLEIIRSNTVGTAFAASVQSQSEGSTDIYRIMDFVQSDVYNFADREKAPDLLEGETIQVVKDQKRKVSYEREGFDETNAGAWAAQYVARASQFIGLGITAILDAEFIKAAYNNCVAQGLNNGYIINDKYSTASTDAELKTMSLQTADISDDLTGIIDKKILGANKTTDVISFVRQKTKTRLIIANNGNSASYEAVKTGSYEMIGSVPIREHMFIGKNIAAGQSFAKDKAYDFSKLENLTVHTEAIALAFNLLPIGVNVEAKSNNIITVSKYQLETAVLRPKLTKMIVNATPSPILLAKGQQVQGSIDAVEAINKTMEAHIKIVKKAEQKERIEAAKREKAAQKEINRLRSEGVAQDPIH